VFYLREIRFYEGDIPADTEEITEPVTEMTTEPSTTAEENTAAPTPGTGCASSLSVTVLPVSFVVFALLSATDSPNRKRRSRRR
jgi:hypothetical protein